MQHLAVVIDENQAFLILLVIPAVEISDVRCTSFINQKTAEHKLPTDFQFQAENLGLLADDLLCRAPLSCHDDPFLGTHILNRGLGTF